MVLRKSFYIRWSAGRSPWVHEVNPSRDPSALRGAGYAWTPGLRSFDKLREVGVSPYWGFTLFKCFSMFRLA